MTASDANGAKIFVRALTPPEDALKTFTADKWTVTYAPRCAFCWANRGDKGHTHIKCPFMESINKVRARCGWEKIVVRNGVLHELGFRRVTVDLQAKVVAVEKELAALGKRVAKLELQAKPDDDKKSKKRKADSSSGGNSPPKKKKKDSSSGGKKGGKGKGKKND